MLQTLKIARLAAAIAAVGFIAFLAMSGLKPDKEMQEVIDKPSFIDKFKKLALNTNRTTTKESPLVTEAKAFAFRINPPPPPKPVEVAETKPKELKIPDIDRPKPPKQVKNSKFSLLATCRYESTPEKSLALLKIVAQGHKWVRQGETVGYLTIHEVKDGSIVLYQGDQEHSEITVRAKAVAKSLMRVESDDLAVAETISTNPRTVAQPSGTAISRPRQVGATPRRTVTVRKRKPAPTPEQMQADLNSNIASIEKIMADTLKESGNDSQAEIDALADFLKILQKDKQDMESNPVEKTKGTPKALIIKPGKNTKE